MIFERQKMEVETIPNAKWSDILKCDTNPTFEFLALQLLLFRLKGRVRKDPSTSQTSAEELKSFFVNNKKIPIAMKDLEKLINLVG